MNLIESVQKLNRYKQEFKGVFSVYDLKNLFNSQSDLDFKRQIRKLEEGGVLERFARGFYVLPPFDLMVLSQRICERSYISLSNVLAEKLIIGTKPRDMVTAVKLGKSRIYEGNQGTIVHLGIAPHLFFGFQTIQGVNQADTEKAFLDALYFYQKGYALYFNVYQDLSLDLLDTKKIKSYLKKYKNPNFISFVEGILNEKH